ncbi:uncharacterized protein J3D65DRAFT_662700 [Phyllosticta citribraziliensis]|uniref:Uncharacterized protein n=1 Tax=Phyllosticta citribraziliensis TaxID=989973 RepID=A0ABR1L3I4_9PEZI
MPLRLPSLNFFRLSRKRDNSAQHCVELVDLNQADADYIFQHEHSTWEESPAPPPNTLCASSSVVLFQRHPSSQFGLALEFGADFEQDWLRRFGGLNSNSNSNLSSLTTVVHHAPFASTPDATPETTAASEASTSTLALPKPPPNLAATFRGRFKSTFKSTTNIASENSSTAHSPRLKTSRAHTNRDSTAAPHNKSDKSATVTSNAHDRYCPPLPPMSNPAHPPRRWRCCRCGRVNAKANAKANARAYDTTMANRNRNRNRHRGTRDHASKTAVAVTAIEDGTWTCRCGHSFEPCLLRARLRCLRRVQRKGGDMGVAFGRG